MRIHTVTRLITAVFILFLAALPLQGQSTWHVDDDAPSDPGPGDPSISDLLEDGSTAHPFDAIQEGIDASFSGDTVQVADGTYTGDGNRDLDVAKSIIIRSKNGAERTTINCGSYNHGGINFHGSESDGSILDGFTVRNGAGDQGMGILCSGSSPTIINNVITWTGSFDFGGGISCANASPLILNNIITNNYSEYGGGIFIFGNSSPIIINNLIANNGADTVWEGAGGGIYCWGEYGECSATIINCTIVENEGWPYGGGIYSNEYSEITIMNSIVWGNSPDQIYAFGSASYCDIQDWGGAGIGNIAADPLFVPGPAGDYYLSQIASGQAVDSPCVDTGMDLAENTCFTVYNGTYCMDFLATRTDQATDIDLADMGYHHKLLPVVSSMTCAPNTGTLPFTTQLCITMDNVVDYYRTLAGQLNLTLTGGSQISNWRAGYRNLSPSECSVTCWNQQFPALGSLVGENFIELFLQDVTPAPYNQPPYPPAGDTDTAACTVTGIAP